MRQQRVTSVWIAVGTAMFPARHLPVRSRHVLLCTEVWRRPRQLARSVVVACCRHGRRLHRSRCVWQWRCGTGCPHLPLVGQISATAIRRLSHSYAAANDGLSRRMAVAGDGLSRLQPYAGWVHWLQQTMDSASFSRTPHEPIVGFSRMPAESVTCYNCTPAESFVRCSQRRTQSAYGCSRLSPSPATAIRRLSPS